MNGSATTAAAAIVDRKKNAQNRKRSSEYASVKRVQEKEEGRVYIEVEQEEPEAEVAVRKMREKYDSLGALRASLEHLELDEHEEQRQPEVDDDAVSEQDVLQVEAFFRSHKTAVYVCPTLANLYLATSASGADEAPQWQLAHTGIPALLLDAGESRCRPKRRIQIVVAERGTGFLLWGDTIDNLSNYEASESNFHTMRLSVDHRRRAGLSFDSVAAARALYDRVELLTSDPANISLSGPAAARRRTGGRRKAAPLPHKSDISQPCCFQHVTRVDLRDRDHYVTLSTLTADKTTTPPRAT